ncbi:TIGR03032 family protein [Aerosakkonemataceae cyanobacterium BLCC-F154]|uniref:TIGR03032 family protein n=1 Tax=Floridaenema fluviatile BLCC-F154 TaxID=3153640 RepID=A0ABV4YB08_9CYAN
MIATTTPVSQMAIDTSRQFTAWLAEQNISLTFTTYQAGKLFFLGLNPNGELSVFERTFPRCMGLYATNSTLYLSSLYQLWRLENILEPGQIHNDYDALYVPQVGYITGDLDIHDVAIGDPPQPPLLRGENSDLVPLIKGDLGGSESHKKVPLIKGDLGGSESHKKVPLIKGDLGGSESHKKVPLIKGDLGGSESHKKVPLIKGDSGGSESHKKVPLIKGDLGGSESNRKVPLIKGDLGGSESNRNQPIFVNTLFSCLATVSETHSFVPLWQPPFISKLAAEDRCHLNGLAMRDGQPRYVTAVSRSDIADGWREKRTDGGCAIDILNNEVIASGLSMPHSPRWYRDKLWLLNSGTGEFGYLDAQTGKFEPVTFCPGYLRGLAFSGDFAIVGLSQARGNKTFSGLPLEEKLAQKNAEARCGLMAIDLRTGDSVHWLRIEGVVEELYDVAVLPGVRRPMALGFRTDEIRRTIRF